ncbi:MULTISPECIES: NAD-dependent malic enzyme [Cysteiniphilum]|uniref:NAD-dependent malic enzyme n=1 Tax=Cysteiniphilum litorale TaxID=2056700 RepID=A0A8J2Z3W8_9GAMM|nr:MULTISPECIES: NAD-dependent malic enzyme [Cysteiniphilum]GGF95516.1 NAD-dependent malic enzyme [Cysteiniphilum litorale]
MFKVITNKDGQTQEIQTSLSAHELMDNPLLNKGTAFSKEERDAFDLHGKLPIQVESLSSQLMRVYRQFQEKNDNIQKNIFLNTLHDSNTTLFYKFCSQHIDEVLPIVYTPTVGDAVEQYSSEFRRPAGIYLAYDEQKQMDMILGNIAKKQQIDFIIVTDGEAVLGIGDWGIGGMDISIGKLMVYIICAGINPANVLPVQLDVGTNNQKLLDDPMYLGARHPRITGKKYDQFIEKFVMSVKKHFPNVYLHWEDFGRDHARAILETYRDQLCTFNDDMQGTGIVATANVISAIRATQTKFTDHKVVMFGAGTAGCGIMDQILDAFIASGMTRKQALDRFYIIDRFGLVVDDMPDLPDFQKPYAKSRKELKNWNINNQENISLLEVVQNAKATILIGCSTVKGAFNKPIVTTMAQNIERPIIMPLSNPNSHCEATPEDLINWTNAKAIIAAGSPFEPVVYQGKTYQISQGNNAFIFPGLGLGAIAVKATKMSDGMIRVASETLASFSPLHQSVNNPVLPPIHDATIVSKAVAIAVAKQAIKEGLSSIKAKEADVEKLVNNAQWIPDYYPLKKQ